MHQAYRNHRFVFLILLVSLLLAACQRDESSYRESFPLFGTLVEIQLRGADQALAQKATAAIQEDFRKMHRHWHAWRSGMLTDLNRALAAGREVEVDPFLLPLLQRSRALYLDSDGLFNPAIGRLIALWGFHADTLPTGPPPGDQAIKALVARNPGMDDLEFRGRRVRSRNRFVQLDLGGIGKGAAVEQAIQRLQEFGINNAMVNAGGDLCVSSQPGGRPWRVGIAHPLSKGLFASLELGGRECVFTSGTYARYRRDNDRNYAHIIDPRSGWPVEHVVSVTVVHDDGIIADAAATALAIAGPAHWQEIARRMGIKHVLLIDSQGRVQITPSLVDRVHFAKPAPAQIRVVTL